MKKERLYYVDWLRTAVILLLVPYHAALTYTGLGDIYIKTPLKDARILPFLFLTVPLDNFFMTLLFFLSGIATYHALQLKGSHSYVRERIRKVLIPFLLGTVLLCPAQAYFKGLNDGFSGSFFQFLPEFFSSKIVDYLGYAHLWFLLYLFLFSLACLPLFKCWLKTPERLGRIVSCYARGNNIFIPIAFIVASETLLRPFFPGKQIIVGDWANDIVYLSIFVFGFIYASDTAIQHRLVRLIKPSIAIVMLSIVSFMALYYSLTVYELKADYSYFLWAFIKGLFECAGIILFVSLGSKYFNKKSAALSYLGKASFTYYLMHLLPVSAFTYLFIGVNMNIYVKYLIVVVLSYAFLFAVYELIVKRLPGRKKKTGASAAAST